MKHGRTLVSAALIVSLLILTGYAAASENYPVKSERITISSKYKEEMATVQAQRGVTEDDSAPFSVKYLLSSLNRYELLDNSVLLDRNARAITPDRLRVPCDAVIEYQTLRNGVRNIVTLKVTRNHSQSSESWAEPLPD